MGDEERIPFDRLPASWPASWYFTQEDEPMQIKQTMKGPLSEVWESLASGGLTPAKFTWDGVSMLFHVRNVAGVSGDFVISGMIQCADRLRFAEGLFRIREVGKDELIGEVCMLAGIGNEIAVCQLLMLISESAAAVVMFVDVTGDGADDRSTWLYSNGRDFELVQKQPDGKFRMMGMSHKTPQPTELVRIMSWTWPNDIVARS